MVPLCCIVAEWQLVRARLVRSRLGLWLLLLAAVTSGWRNGVRRSSSLFLALAVGMEAAVLCVAFCAGSDADRAALALTLTHPTTPAALAWGRWLAALTAAAILMLGCLAAAAGAVAACALLAVWVGGNTCAGVLFLYIALASPLAPEGLRQLSVPGPLRSLGVAILDLLPGVWRYRRLAGGEPGAWLHVALWVVVAVPLAGAIARRRLA